MPRDRYHERRNSEEELVNDQILSTLTRISERLKQVENKVDFTQHPHSENTGRTAGHSLRERPGYNNPNSTN